MARIVYMDHAATTAVKREVVDAMLPYFSYKYGNPSSVYSISQMNKDAIENSRKMIAKALNTNENSIYFTSGGSEADNWALKKLVNMRQDDRKHIITTSIEHHAILNSAESLKKEGYDITYLPVNTEGIVNLRELESAIRPDTALISVMFANNEIGSIQPIAEIGSIARKHRVIFHTDAVQAFGQIPIDVEKMNIDALSASGHKFCGPKGIGFLYVREGVKINNFIHGGGQEKGKRAGTENVPGIVGIGKATEIAMKKMNQQIVYETWLRNYMANRILKEIPYCRLNGHAEKRLPNNINVSFQFVDGESMLIMLDMAGICASAGSACSSGESAPSHVLRAIGLPEYIARGTLRLTLGEENTKQEVDYVVNQLKEIVWRLREKSPAYEDYIRKNKKSAY